MELGGRGDVALVVGGVGHHLHGGDADVATDSEGDEEATGDKNGLGESFAHAAARAFRLNIFVNLAKWRPANIKQSKLSPSRWHNYIFRGI